MKKMDNKLFTTKIYYVFEDKNIQKPSIEWLKGLIDKCKSIDSDRFLTGIDKLISIPQDEWNKTYGFKGRPSIVDLVEILSGDRPLSDEEKFKKIEAHKAQMRIYTAQIASGWLDDERFNIRFAFVGRYKNPENAKLKAMIDEFLDIKEELTDERILKMGNYLRKKLLADKGLFFEKMLGIAKKQNPAPYQIENKPRIESRALPLPTFKKI